MPESGCMRYTHDIPLRLNIGQISLEATYHHDDIASTLELVWFFDSSTMSRGTCAFCGGLHSDVKIFRCPAVFRAFRGVCREWLREFWSGCGWFFQGLSSGRLDFPGDIIESEIVGEEVMEVWWHVVSSLGLLDNSIIKFSHGKFEALFIYYSTIYDEFQALWWRSSFGKVH